MDKRTFGFLLITFAICISLTESFPRLLSNMHDNQKLMIDEEWQPTRSHNLFTDYGSGVPDDLSKPEDSSEEQSGSYSLETQQQVSQKEYLFPVQSDSSEQQNGDNQFTFTSSGEQFTVEPENSGTRQQDILFTGDHSTTAFETGNLTPQKIPSDETGTPIDSATRINDGITNSSQFLTSVSTSDSLTRSIVTTDLQSPVTEKTTTAFTGNSGSSTENPTFDFKTSSTSDKIRSTPTELNPTNSHSTIETSAEISFETSDKITPDKASSTNQEKSKSEVTLKISSFATTELPHEEDNGHSTLKSELSSSPISSSDISDTSDTCDSTTFVKPTAGPKPTNAGKCRTSFTDPPTPSTGSDIINLNAQPTTSSEPEEQATKDKAKNIILNNKSTSEAKIGGTLGLSGSERIFVETSDDRKISSSSPAGSQNFNQESTSASSESTYLTDQSSFSSPAGTGYTKATTGSSASTSIEVNDVVLPDISDKNEHTRDNHFFIAPPFLSKHISKDADKILYESHTSNTHDHLNHSDAGIPHNVLDEHTNSEQQDSPHTDASANITENPHHTIRNNEPELPHSKHIHDSLHAKSTDSPHHIIGGDEPHCHHMDTSHHTKPAGSPQHIVGGDEPQLPHSHHMKTSHHSHTGTLHHIIGGDEPKLPHSHHMNATPHTKLTGNLNHAIGSNKPKLSQSSHMDASPHLLRGSINKEDFLSNTSHSSTEVTVGETVNDGKVFVQSEIKSQEFAVTENNERTSHQPVTESKSSVEDSLRPVHADKSINSSVISPGLLQISKHASVQLLSETVETDPSIQSATEIPHMGTSAANNIGQVSSAESIFVSDEQHPSENDQFPIQNHNSQDSEQPQESVADIQFSDKPTTLQEHVTDNSKNPIKPNEMSDDSSVQNQGSSSFASSIVSSLRITENVAQHQDTTFLSRDMLPKKQTNGDLQYFIEQVIYPKQIGSNIMSSSVKQVSAEPSDTKSIQNTKAITESSDTSAFEPHSKTSSHTTENILFTKNNVTLADKQSEFTSSASVTKVTTEKPSFIQSSEEQRFTIPEILSTVPGDDRTNHGSMPAVDDTVKITNSSSTISSVPDSTVSVKKMTTGESGFRSHETTAAESVTPSSNNNIQQSMLDSKQVGNTFTSNSPNSYYSTATATTLSTYSQSTTISSTPSGTISTSPEVETISSSSSSQGTTENPTTSSSLSLGTISTTPEVETTSSSTSSQGTTESPTSTSRTSLGTMSTSPEAVTTSSSTNSQGTTENQTSRTSSSTSLGSTSSSPEIETTSPSSSSTVNPSPTSSGTTSTSSEAETTSSSTLSQGTTENPTSSTSSSTSDTTNTSPEVQSTTPNYSTRNPPYGLLATESLYFLSTDIPHLRSYPGTTNRQLTTSQTSVTTPPAFKITFKKPLHVQSSTTTSATTSDEHFGSSSENSDKGVTFSPIMSSDQLTTSFESSDFSHIKFERPPKPLIGVKHGSPGIKGGDRNKMFYHSKPLYYIEGWPLHNPF